MPMVHVARRPLTRSSKPVPHEVLGEGVYVYNQYASEFLEISKAPNWHTAQLIIVAAAAGSTSLNDRLKELWARFESAVSTLPARDSFIGLRALTKPESMKKMATHA